MRISALRGSSTKSWVPWAAAFALYPAFLSYGGWGGQERGAPPEIAVTVLAAVLGVGVHLLTSLWGLVADNEDNWTYLPLRLGRRIGASRLLWVALACPVQGLEFDARTLELIDTNHDNSGKQYMEQIRIVRQTLQNRDWNEKIKKTVRGFMIESYLADGRQNQPEVFGCSITDPCLGWENTEALVEEIYATLTK